MSEERGEKNVEHVSRFLSKFKRYLPAYTETRHMIAKSIMRSTEIKIRPTDVRLSGRIAYISVAPIKKSSIMIKEREILEYIWARTGKQFPERLR